MIKSSSDDTNAVFVAEAKAGCFYLPLLFCSGSGAAFLLLLGLVARTRIALDKRFVCILNGQISIRVNNGTQQSHVLLSADVGVVVLIDATKPLRLDVSVSFLDETLTVPHSALELFLGLHRLRKHPSKIELGATHAKCEDRIVSSAVVLLVPIYEIFFEFSGKVIDSSYLGTFVLACNRTAPVVAPTLAAFATYITGWSVTSPIHLPYGQLFALSSI